MRGTTGCMQDAALQDAASCVCPCISKTVRPNDHIYSSEESEDEDLFADNESGKDGRHETGALKGNDEDVVASKASKDAEVIEKVKDEDEIQEQTYLPHPGDPSSQEVHEHQASGHVQYRSWCSSCVCRGRCVSG